MRKLYLGFISFFFTCLCWHSSHAAIILNEVMPCNVSTVINDYQNYTGWVEVYNNGTANVDLKGYTFVNEYLNEDKVKESNRWTVLKNVNISPGGYLLFFFNEDENEKDKKDGKGGGRYADYKIETDGGEMILLDAANKEIGRLSYGTMVAHVSWGKCGNDEGYMANPTPKAPNASCLGYTLKRVQKPAFNPTPGLYNTSGSVSVTLQSESGATIYYTTNGSEPTQGAAGTTQYTGPISVNKTTVIRARAYKQNVILSDIAAGTYVFNKDAKDVDHHSPCGGFTVPIVSISTNPTNFFDDQMGIYVVGKNGIPGPPSCDGRSANYRQDWKRPVHFEYIVNGRQVISQELDAGTMGGCSLKEDQKSLKLSASKKLGNNKILYDFFPSAPQVKEYKSLQLRNLGNDYHDARIRDPFMQSLVNGRMNVDNQGYQPVAFYINGEYYGHIAMMERANKDYPYSRFGLKSEEIDILEVNGEGVDSKEGDVNAYNNLLAEAQKGQTTADYYEKMNRLMDIDEYIDYQIIEQYVGNTDWPNNNTRFWRENTTGRFRWILYDTDFGFAQYDAGGPNYCDVNLNMINFAQGLGYAINWANKDKRDMVLLYSNLMKNNEFCQRFLNRYILHLGTTFVPKRVTDILESVRKGAENEICAHWKKFTKGWAANNSMTNFANARQGNVYNHLKDYYGLGSLVNLKISANISNADFIMNGERLNTSNYDGKYYKNMDLKVQPIAPAGYKFVSWNLTSAAVTETYLDNKTEWKYYNQGNQPAGNWYGSFYEDTGWATGSGTFGYQTNTARPSGFYTTTLGYGGNASDKWVTAYFRTSFNIPDKSAVSELQATVLYDDGVVIYLNGKEIQRYNMPTGAISYTTSAASIVEVDEQKIFTIDTKDLLNGNNVIAVEVHQVAETSGKVTSSDLTFKMDLVGKVNSNSTSNQAYNANVQGDVDLKATFEKISYVKPALFINELCVSNGKKSGVHDEYGNYGDWIEVYNAGDVAVDLAGMYLEENSKGITYRFPAYNPFETTVPARKHKVIWADKQMWQGSLHASFKLTAGVASTLILYEMEGGTKREIDRVSYPKDFGTKSESYGRETDGASKWVTFGYCPGGDIFLATPGEKNGSKSCENVSVEDVISDDVIAAMSLYPNPAKTFLNIVVNSSDSYSMQVYDDKGRLIEYMPAVNEGVVTLNLQGYAPGIYIVKAVTKEAVLQQKFVKY